MDRNDKLFCQIVESSNCLLTTQPRIYYSGAWFRSARRTIVVTPGYDMADLQSAIYSLEENNSAGIQSACSFYSSDA